MVAALALAWVCVGQAMLTVVVEVVPGVWRWAHGQCCCSQAVSLLGAALRNIVDGWAMAGAHSPAAASLHHLAGEWMLQTTPAAAMVFMQWGRWCHAQA